MLQNSSPVNIFKVHFKFVEPLANLLKSKKKWHRQRSACLHTDARFEYFTSLWLFFSMLIHHFCLLLLRDYVIFRRDMNPVRKRVVRTRKSWVHQILMPANNFCCKTSVKVYFDAHSVEEFVYYIVLTSRCMMWCTHCLMFDFADKRRILIFWKYPLPRLTLIHWLTINLSAGYANTWKSIEQAPIGNFSIWRLDSNPQPSDHNRQRNPCELKREFHV